MTEEKLFRSDSTRPLAAVLAFFGVAIFAVGAGGLSGGVNHSLAVTVVGAMAMLVGALEICWTILYFARMGVIVTDQGIIIRNWFRRTHIGWPEIAAFRFGTDVDHLTVREQMSSPFLQTYAVTTDGRHFVMCGVTATRLMRARSREKVREILARLEDERLTHSQPA
jgi:hypothetical protein